MEYLELFDNKISLGGFEATWLAALLFIIAFIALIIQLWYWLGCFGKLHRYRNITGPLSKAAAPPVSVIVVVRENNFYFVNEILPLLLNQDHPEYEVVVVDCSYNDQILGILSDLGMECGNLHVTSFKAQSQLEHSTKLALTVGIKAARHEHLVFTTADSYPASEKWVGLMAKGFITADVVIGYSGIEYRRGFANRMIRSSRLINSIKFLSAATRGYPYRGMAGNLGYTKTLYFGNKGFNHLNMNIGDDDLFLQKFLSGENVSVVMNPRASVWEIQYGGLGWWYSVLRFFGASLRYYPGWAKRYVGGETWSRGIFFIASGFSIWLFKEWLWLIPVFLILVRLVLVENKIIRICRRLGERGLGWIYPVYDIFSPFASAWLSVVRKIRPNKTVWR